MNALLNTISIKAKIIGLAGILVLSSLTASTYALKNMFGISLELEAISQQDIPLTKILTKITEHQMQQAIYFERALRYATAEYDSTQFQKYRELFSQYNALVDEEIIAGEKLIAAAISNTSSKIMKDGFHNFETQLKSVDIKHKNYGSQAADILVQTTEGITPAIQRAILDAENNAQELAQELDTLLIQIETFTQEATIRATQHEKQAMTNQAIITLVGLVVGTVISFLIATNIVGRLRDTAHAFSLIAAGDLTHDNLGRDGKDEISDLREGVQKMSTKLRGIVKKIDDLSIVLSSAAEQLAAVTSQTSLNIQNQQGETEQVASAMNEMTATVAEVASNASNASTASSDANREAVEGNNIQIQTLESIESLAEQIDCSADAITEVEQDSETINKVLEVISSIAEQTNLLALNAAIEAARAGEQGRGFAVVADEVRTLAGRTAESTLEINHIIEKLQSGSRNAVAAMTSSKAKAQTVVEKANNLGTVLSTITHSIADISGMGMQIATAAEEQNAVAEEINRNILRIRDLSAENTTGTSQTTKAASELAQMANELRDMLLAFKVV